VTQAAGYGRGQVRVIMSGLLLATFVAALDQTVVTAALFLLAIAVFLAGSALCAVAASMPMLAACVSPEPVRR